MFSKKLVDPLVKKFPELGEESIRVISTLFFKGLATSLKNEKRVELRKFGVFKLKYLPNRVVYNPYDKINDYVEAAKIPAFKCSDSLHKIEKE